MGVRVVGLGQRLAGDDAVGLEIVRRLRDEGVPPGVELLEATDGAALLALLETPRPVLVVDAVVGNGEPGTIVELDEARIGASSDRLLSTHGLDVAAAVGLARQVFAGRATPAVRVIGVRIAAPSRGEIGLSPLVSAALSPATRAVRAWATNGIGPIVGRRIELAGIVQGVGLRPWLYRLALATGVTGQVSNRAAGVTVDAFAPAPALDAFLDRLRRDVPAPAHVDRLTWSPIPWPGQPPGEFSIVESDSTGTHCPSIPPDLATCDDCLAEIFDPSNRRYRYPFTSCTACGPRTGGHGLG
jgi:hydrogenase maturation protease